MVYRGCIWEKKAGEKEFTYNDLKEKCKYEEGLLWRKQEVDGGFDLGIE